MFNRTKKILATALLGSGLFLTGCGSAQMPFAPGALNAKAGSGGASTQVGGQNGGSTGAAVKVSYTRDALPIFQKNCTMCHGAGKMNPKDWTKYDVAFANKDLIFLRIVTRKDMPLGMPMSDSDRELIGEWVKLGALDTPAETTPAPAPNPAPAPEPTATATSEPVPSPTATATATPAPTMEPAPSPTLIVTPTFRGQVRDIFVNRCSMCHGEGKMNPNDWTEYTQAFAKKDRIIQRVVVEKSMPLGMPLPDAEFAIVKAWLEGGAPEAAAAPAPAPAPEITLKPVTFRGQIQELFTSRCSMCHNTQSWAMNPNDWTDYATAFAKKDRIYQRVVVEGTMPMGSPLEDSDRELVRRWIDGGAALE